MKYNIKHLCCNTPTHNPNMMNQCEDLSHDIASWYSVKESLDHIIHITKVNDKQDLHTKKYISKRQIYDHKMIGIDLTQNNKNIGTIYSYNIEGLCNTKKYPKESSVRFNKFSNQMKTIAKPGLILCIQELLLKSDECIRVKKCISDKIKYIQKIFKTNGINLKYVYDKFTNIVFYDSDTWKLNYKHTFKSELKRSRKDKNMIICGFEHLLSNTKISIINIHLKAFLPYYKNKYIDYYHYSELYEVFEWIQKNNDMLLNNCFCVGDHNNSRIKYIYESIFDVLSN